MAFVSHLNFMNVKPHHCSVHSSMLIREMIEQFTQLGVQWSTTVACRYQSGRVPRGSASRQWVAWRHHISATLFAFMTFRQTARSPPKSPCFTVGFHRCQATSLPYSHWPAEVLTFDIHVVVLCDVGLGGGIILRPAVILFWPTPISLQKAIISHVDIIKTNPHHACTHSST